MRGDEHWERWIAKGRARQALTRERMTTVAIAIGSAIAFGLAIALTIKP